MKRILFSVDSMCCMKATSTGDEEFDKCIPLFAYTTEKFIPVVMLNMPADPLESQTIITKKSH